MIGRASWPAKYPLPSPHTPLNPPLGLAAASSPASAETRRNAAINLPHFRFFVQT
jgi:hypothetical protein